MSILTLNATKLPEMREICQCQLRVFTVSHFITSLRRNKKAVGPEKNRVLIFFEIFVLSELVCSYDKVNKYAKKKVHIISLLS